MHHAYNCNLKQNVLRVFLFVNIFNSFVKICGYCKVSCLEGPKFKAILVSMLFFIYNLLVSSDYCNFIQEFNKFF